MRDEPVRAGIEGVEEAPHLVAGEHRGQTPGTVGPFDGADVPEGNVQHVVVQKREGVERLILGGGGHVPVGGQVIEKGLDLLGPEVARVSGVVEVDEAPDPPDVCAFGVQAVLAAPTGSPHAVEEFGGLIGGHTDTAGKAPKACA